MKVFRLIVVLALALVTVLIGGPAQARVPTSTSLTWVGYRGDLVGSLAGANGTKDGEFQLTVVRAGEFTIQTLALHSDAWNSQANAPMYYWDTYNGQGWILGVTKKGHKLLNASNETISITATDHVVLKLWANPAGDGFPGSSFHLHVDFLSGTDLELPVTP